MAQAETVEQIWNRTRGEGNPEYARVDPDFRARLQSVYAEAQRGGPESGIAGLEEFEAEVRKGTKRPDELTRQERDGLLRPTARDAVALQAAEPTPQGNGAQDSDEKAKKDAAGAGARVEADEAHSPSAPSAARPLAAEAPGSGANPLPDDAGDEDDDASGSTKRGKLPEGFPGLSALTEAGVTSYGKLRALKGDYTSVPGVGDATATKIKEELGEEE